MTTKYSYILTTIFFIATSSLCSEKSIQIRAESLVCPTDNYAVIQTDNTTWCIYDLIQKKKIHEIKDEGPIYKLTKHPHKPLIAISRHTDINKCIDTISIYTIPEGNKISDISKGCFLSNPIFNPVNTTILINNSLKSFFIFNYTTNKTKEIAKPDKIHLMQPVKIPNDTHNNKSYIMLTNCLAQHNKYAQYWLSLFIVNNQERNFYNYPINQDQILSSAFHPTNPYLIALLATKQCDIKQSNYDHILVHLFNVKNEKKVTLLNKKFSELKNSLNDSPINANLIDFFNNGTQLIISFINKCITIDIPNLKEFYENV